jgi:cytidine deaminase
LIPDPDKVVPIPQVMSPEELIASDPFAVFPLQVQEELQQTLSTAGVIHSEQVASWLEVMGIEIGTLMIQLLPVAALYARVPISGYHVGAVALGMPPALPGLGPGSLYLGSNMEFTGEALSFCVHGEQSATNNAWLHGETGLQALAINAAPCGYCRQFLYEISTATKGFNILLKVNDHPDDYSYTMKPLTHYLPDAFGPGNLDITDRLMDTQAHNLTISGGDSVAQVALVGANASYSPYTNDYTGVGVVNAGVTYAGRYAENAAYNPSMSPMESALAFMNMNMAAQAPIAITEAVLVEAAPNPTKPSTQDISQRSAAEVVLSSIAPGVALQYFEAT